MKTRWRFVAMIVLALGGAGFGLVGAHAAGLGQGSSSAASAAKKKQPAGTPTPAPVFSPGSIELMATPDEIICDGAHTTRVRVHLRDANGHDVKDETPVYFGMTGRVGYLNQDVATTTKGIAETDARAIFDPLALYRPFFVQVDAGKIEATIRVFCLPPADCVPGVSCTRCDQPTSTPQVSPPACPPSPPPCDPVSPPQAFSPPCGLPNDCDPTSPPQSVSPPCVVATPPSPPPCDPTSPPQSPPSCATPTPGCSPFAPLSGPCVPPSLPSGAPTSPPCSGSEFAVALDCDIAVAGIQSNCTVAPGTNSLDVAVVFGNDFDLATTLAAFNFNLHDTDTSRLNPLPGADANQDGNPDFNQADLTSSWNCDFPPPMTDTGADGPGRANSFLSCYTFAATPPVTVGPGGRINLAIVHYAIPANATDGSVQLALDDVSVANFDAITLVICGYGSSPCPPPAIVTIGSGANGSATPVTATATPIPAPTG